MAREVTIVSGLPRTGTSLMMQMLNAGGVEVLTDQIRIADTDNPNGYYELERVKKIRQDASWLPSARDKAFKMVSQLLYDLPPTEIYRIIFMERDLHETLLSQEKMLQRLGRPAAPREEMRRFYSQHISRLRDWLPRQRHMDVLYVNYNDLMAGSREQAQRVRDFLGGGGDLDAMARTVDPSLYRNRKIAGDWV